MRRAVLLTLVLVPVTVGVVLVDAAPGTRAPSLVRSVAAMAAQTGGGSFGLTRLSEKSQRCLDCHRRTTPGLYETWGDSRHFRANVGCYECHAAGASDPDVFFHYNEEISIIVSPADCARCHAHEVEEFLASRHAHGGSIAGSLDAALAEVVEGNNALMTLGFPNGNSAASVSGCWPCHGSPVRVLPNGTLDPATWPNTGIGRINPDGSTGSCSACHARHAFSVAQARHPDACGRCHTGSAHPQREIYAQSKHGVLFSANESKLNLDSAKWIVGEDYSAAPTCTTCHMSATPTQPVTHDTGQRISWNNRPEVSVRPDAADAARGLPGAEIPWESRRENMKDVCLNCHDVKWVDGFYTQYDGFIELYNGKFAEPGRRLYALAGPLLEPVEFGNALDFIWFDLWHQAGRRARHGVSMMGHDHAQWRGMYPVARTFYTEFVPELRRLIEAGRGSGDPERVRDAETLDGALTEVLGHDDHKWFVGGMSPEAAQRRRREAEAFRSQYRTP